MTVMRISSLGDYQSCQAYEVFISADQLFEQGRYYQVIKLICELLVTRAINKTYSKRLSLSLDSRVNRVKGS